MPDTFNQLEENLPQAFGLSFGLPE